MVSFAPTSPDTVEDQRRYLDARLTDLACLDCLDCLAVVRVKKNSQHHTSVQWTARATASCQEFARLEQQAAGRPVHAGCSRLLASMDQATREGRLDVGALDDY